LQNNRCRDVRHDAESKNRQSAEVTAAEQVKKTKRRSLILAENLRQNVNVDPRRGNHSADAIHSKQAQREKHTLPQIRDAEDVQNGLEKSVHCTNSALPPAAAIFSLADALNACA